MLRVTSVDYMTTKLTLRQHGGWRGEVESQLSSFGDRLRKLRLQRGWTLEELAKAGHLSKTFLSRLESGGRQPSIAAALTLARILGVSLADLFEPARAGDPCVIVRARDAVERSARGLTYAPLSSAGRFFNLQPMRVKVSPFRRGRQHFHHAGEEWIYVLAGALTLSLAGKNFDLERGDAAHFDSRLPHRLIARGGVEAEVLVVASPPSDSSAPPRPGLRELRAIPVMRLPWLDPGPPLLSSNNPQSADPPQPSRKRKDIP